MEVYQVEEDMHVFCVKAESFPNEIGKAFEQLIGKLPTGEGRTFFGIAYQEGDGEMVYKAGVLETYPGEGEACGCGPYTIQKGQYLTEMIRDWKKDTASIGKAFRRLGDSRPDTSFPCIEWYQGSDVLCMVRLAS